MNAMAGRVESEGEDDGLESVESFKRNVPRKIRERNPRFHRHSINFVRCKSSKYLERTPKCDHGKTYCQATCPPQGQFILFLVHQVLPFGNLNDGAGGDERRGKCFLPNDCQQDSSQESPFPLGEWLSYRLDPCPKILPYFF
jgi:hypothetical protein